MAALAAGRRNCNLPRLVLISSVRSGFHKPKGETLAPPRLTPNLLSTDGPQSRISDPLCKGMAASIPITASKEGSLLMIVRTMGFLAS